MFLVNEIVNKLIIAISGSFPEIAFIIREEIGQGKAIEPEIGEENLLQSNIALTPMEQIDLINDHVYYFLINPIYSGVQFPNQLEILRLQNTIVYMTAEGREVPIRMRQDSEIFLRMIEFQEYFGAYVAEIILELNPEPDPFEPDMGL